MSARPRRGVVGSLILALSLLGLPAGSRTQDSPVDTSSAPPVGAAYHTATWSANARLLVAGGVGPNGVTDRLEFFDLLRGSTVSTLTAPRAAHTLTLLPDGTVLIAGGTDAHGALDGLEVVDPTSRASTPLGLRLTRAVSEHTATLLPDGRILLVGGRDARGQSVARVEALDLVNGYAVELLDTLEARAGHTATLLSDGHVLIVGGQGHAGVLDSAELWDVSGLGSAPVAGRMQTARAGHSATLLPTGQILIVGGIGSEGRPLSSMERFDSTTGSFLASPARLATPRAHHSATLLPSGDVLVWGGVDASGAILATGEIIAPRTESVRVVTQPLAILPVDQIAPALLASLPANGARDVPTTVRVALRFSEPLAVTRVTPSAVALSGPGGIVASTIVPAESGLLAFVTPAQPLESGTTYTLRLDGLTDTAGWPLPITTLTFTTVAAKVPRSGGGSVVRLLEAAPFLDEQDTSLLVRDSRTLRLHSRWEAQPRLQAPPGVTAVSGLVLRMNGEPLAGVTVAIEDRRTQTDATGRFLLTGIPTGSQVLVLDGRSANRPGVSYGVFEVSVKILAKRTNELWFTSWMPPIDWDHAVTFPSPTTTEIPITTPEIRDFEIRIPPETIVRDRDGQVVTRLSITPLPTDNRVPFPLPPDVIVPIYFTVQPGGAHLETLRADIPHGARVIYPNVNKGTPGAPGTLWNYEPQGGIGWHPYGTGSITPDGKTIAPDPGIAIYKFTGSMFGDPGLAPPSGPCEGDDGCPSDGEPVDLGTGLFVLNKTDLVVQDIPPIVLTRTYRPLDTRSRAFGIGASHRYEVFLVGRAVTDGYVDLILPDGGRVHYDSVDHRGDLFEHRSTSTVFYGSQIRLIGPYAGWTLTFKDGTVWTFPDGFGALTPSAAAIKEIRDRYGNTLTMERTRDTFANLTRVVSSTGRWIEFTYDRESRITQATDQLGRTVSYTYDALGRLQTVTDPNGGITAYTYDSAHRLLTAKDARGIVFLTNEYYPNGRIRTQTQADGTTYEFAYTEVAGRITQTDVTDPRGYVRRVTFGDNGYVATDTRALGQPEEQTRRYEWRADRLLAKVTDALGRETQFDYDTAGNVRSIHRRPGTSDAVTTEFAYLPPFAPGFNRIARVTPSLASPRTRIAFDYDDAFTDTQGLLTITDPLNRQTKVLYNVRGPRELRGRVESFTDPLQHTTSFRYSGQGDLVGVRGPLSNVTTLSYDAIGRFIAYRDARGRTTSLLYDALDRLTAIGDPGGGTTRLTYDATGNLLSVTDARGKTIRYFYDQMERLQTRRDPLGSEETFGYDDNGNPEEVTDRKGQTATFTYDALNRRTRASYAGDASWTALEYDREHRLTRIVDSIGGAIVNEYDPLNRLLAQTTSLGTVRYRYNDLHRTEMTAPGQPTVFYDYYDDGRLQTVRQGAQTVRLDYDELRRRSLLTLPNGVTSAYQYDATSRLTTLTYRNAVGALGNLGYAYDSASYRTAVTGNLARTLLPDPVRTAVYDDANRQLRFGDQVMTYDESGNLLARADAADPANPTVFTWDARDRLTAVAAPDATASFTYDGLGRRITKTIDARTIQYLYDDVDIVEEREAKTSVTYLRSLSVDEPFVRNGSEFYLFDALGSVLGLADRAGALATRYLYEPFGRTAAEGVDSTNPFQFTGRENDGIADLYFYRMRSYAPGFGRFLSEDPLGLLAGVNFYRYARNNPISFSDPLGLDVTVILYPGGFGQGHIGVGVGPGCQTTGLYYGSGGGLTPLGVTVDGQLRPDTRVPIGSITIQTTPQQDDIMNNFIRNKGKGPIDYNLYNDNCAHFVEAVLRAGKLGDIPDTKLPWKLFQDLQSKFNDTGACPASGPGPSSPPPLQSP